MIASINRRTLLAASAAMAVAPGDVFAQSAQTFYAGLVAAAPRPPGAPAGGPPPAGTAAAARGAAGGGRGAQTDEDRVKNFLLGMDDAARLGVHYVEKSNPPDPLFRYYKGRESAFKDELDKRNLKLAGLANNCHAGRADLRAAMVAQNLDTARFVKAMGGHYICIVLDPVDGNDGAGEVGDYKGLDFKTIAANLDEIARTSKEETGIPVGYHPEHPDSDAGLNTYLMENTQHLMYWPDIGWMQMAGLDAVALCKKYYAKTIGMHLRDFAPPK